MKDDFGGLGNGVVTGSAESSLGSALAVVSDGTILTELILDRENETTLVFFVNGLLLGNTVAEVDLLCPLSRLDSCETRRCARAGLARIKHHGWINVEPKNSGTVCGAVENFSREQKGFG